MKIFTVCQSGLGTSFMVQMNIQQILEEVGVDTDNFQIDHTDVGSASGDMADYLFVEKTLQDALGSIPEEKLIPNCHPPRRFICVKVCVKLFV